MHIEGRRAYELARAGQDVQCRPRPVRVYEIQLRRYDWPTVELEISCGAGTYIRSIARDLGRVLGVGAYCQSLTRLAVGAFRLEDAVALDQLDPAKDLVDPLTGLGDVPRATVNDQQAQALALGKRIALPADAIAPPADAVTLPADAVALRSDAIPLPADATSASNGLQPEPAHIAATNRAGELLAILEPAPGQMYQPVKVFNGTGLVSPGDAGGL